MKKLLVYYPKLFNCYSKFERKLINLTSNIDRLNVIFQEDPNSFIAEVCKKFPNFDIGSNLQNVDLKEIEYAIIFDDGECFTEEIEKLNNANVVLRVVKIKITRVINIHKEPELQSQRSSSSYEYIGRGSYWGNPYSMFENGDSREEVIRKYKYDFDYDKFPNKSKNKVYELAGKRLGCFCKPAACHGDVLADYLNSLDDGN